MKGFKRWYYSLRIYFGAEICPVCGSRNIIKRGFEGYNLRHDCRDCGGIDA